MATFTIGEEVIFGEERYVISSVSGDPVRYRLLATGRDGAKIVWARPDDLHKIERYTAAQDDTGRY